MLNFHRASEEGRNVKLAGNIEDSSLNMSKRFGVDISFHDVTVSIRVIVCMRMYMCF